MGRLIVPNAYVGVRVKGSERCNIYQCLAHSKFSISGYYYLAVILLLNIENTGADMKLRGRNYRVLNGGLLGLDFILEMKGCQ